MAGQPPDGSWQSASPNGQPGPEQVRVAWQPPQAQPQSYGPGQSFEQEQAYGQGRPYPQPPYAQASGGYSEGSLADQHTQAWEPGAQQAPGQQFGAQQAAPQQFGGQQYGAEQAGPQQAGWPPPPGNSAFAARQRHVSRQKGFVASLFDFGFNSFVTPKVIKGLYVLAALWTIFVAVFLLLVAVHLGGANPGTIIFCLISLAIFILLSLGTIRVFLEFFMALHRINENIQSLRDRDEAR
jgi:hypothetical protein